MSGKSRRHRASTSVLVAGLTMSAVGCRASELLNVPTPANLISAGQLGDSAGAEGLRVGTIGLFAFNVGVAPGQVRLTGILTDEFADGDGSNSPQVPPVNARALNSNAPTLFDGSYGGFQKVRIMAGQAVKALEQSAPSSTGTEVAELFALAGYTEVLLGEDVCPGVPLSNVSSDGTAVYGDPLPTDSLFTRALIDFDSAAAHDAGDPSTASLIAVGQGRALVDLGRYAEAAARVAQVPVGFVYSTTMAPSSAFSVYAGDAQSGDFTVADQKGINGLAFVSAHDPRVPTVTLGTTFVGTPWIYPLKFPMNANTNDPIPLADGVEAQLIIAEAALAAHDPATWLTTLNQLRANYVTARGPYPADTSYHTLASLGDPGSDSARVSLTFRERAFWLYGTGHRLGDLRRLIRQYGRDQSTVFPSGPYLDGAESVLYPTYGTAVNFPIGSVEQTNPKFHGCSSSAA